MAIQRVDNRKVNKIKKYIAKPPPNVPVKEPPSVPSYPSNESSGSSTPGVPDQPQKDRGKSDKPKVGRREGIAGTVASFFKKKKWEAIAQISNLKEKIKG